MPKLALVRKPARNFPKCLTKYPNSNHISYEIALEQHDIYCKTLQELGLEIIQVPEVEAYADSCFIEDTAVIHHKSAFITYMGAESRRGEESTVYEILQQYFNCYRLKPPATLEGGDVIHFKNYFIIGQTQRTNNLGINSLENYFKIPVKKIANNQIIHLKSYVTALNDQTIIITEYYSSHKHFLELDKIIIPDSKFYVTNTLNINDTILMVEGYPLIKNRIQEMGYEVISLNISEFQKCEGSLTCLSLIF